MEFLLFVALGGIALWLIYRALNKESGNRKHPLDYVNRSDEGVSTASNKTVEVVDSPAVQPAPVAQQETTPNTDVQKTNVLDVNKDGKVDLKDAAEVVKKTRSRVKKAADVDGDGKVTVKDVKSVARKSKKTAETVSVTKRRSKKS